MQELTVSQLFQAADAAGMRASELLCAILCAGDYVDHRHTQGGAEV